MYGGGIGTTPLGQVDLLDSVDVHDDVGHIAEQPQASAVSGQLKVLTDICAVELQRVRASLTLEDVTAIAGVPAEHIVAGTTEQDVIAATADERVVAVATEQDVGAVAADDRVISGPAVDGEPDQT